MQTYRELELFYDGMIPRRLRDAALRATPTAGAEYRALLPLDRLRADVDRERVAIRLDWSDIRKLCRERDGVLPGLLEAHRRYHETGDRYYLGRWSMVRRRLDTHLRILRARRDKLAELQRQLVGATKKSAVYVNAVDLGAAVASASNGKWDT